MSELTAVTQMAGTRFLRVAGGDDDGDAAMGEDELEWEQIDIRALERSEASREAATAARRTAAEAAAGEEARGRALAEAAAAAAEEQARQGGKQQRKKKRRREGAAAGGKAGGVDTGASGAGLEDRGPSGSGGGQHARNGDGELSMRSTPGTEPVAGRRGAKQRRKQVKRADAGSLQLRKALLGPRRKRAAAAPQ